MFIRKHENQVSLAVARQGVQQKSDDFGCAFGLTQDNSTVSYVFQVTCAR